MCSATAAVTSNHCSLQEAHAARAEIFGVGGGAEAAIIGFVQESLALGHISVSVILVSVERLVNGRGFSLLNVRKLFVSRLVTDRLVSQGSLEMNWVLMVIINDNSVMNNSWVHDCLMH